MPPQQNFTLTPGPTITRSPSIRSQQLPSGHRRSVTTHAGLQSTLHYYNYATPPHPPMRAAATSTAISLLSSSRLRTSTPARLPFRCRRPLRLAAMATNASFRPEAARSPPAVEPPTPPLSKVKPPFPCSNEFMCFWVGSGFDLILRRVRFWTQFKVALCQLSVTADKARNIARARTAIESAAADGAKLVLLPVSAYGASTSSPLLLRIKIKRDAVLILGAYHRSLVSRYLD